MTLNKTKTASSGRILELDALRGLAALAVVLFHFTTRYNELFGHTQTLDFAVPWGHYGVDLFFMLSGFVILLTLERTANTAQFAWGRFSRLYPTYWAAALVTFFVVSLCGLAGQEVTLTDALLNLTMLQSLLGADHIDGAYWSLQAELIFYANMLLLYQCGAFRRPSLAVGSWLGVAFAIQLIRPEVADVWPMVDGLLSKLATIASLKFIPLFAIGIVFYSAKKIGQLSVGHRLLILGSLATVAVSHGPQALVADALLALLLWIAVDGHCPALASRPLIYLGGLSYSLYLIHQNIGYIVIREFQVLGFAPLFSICMALLLTLACSVLLHRFVERPSLKCLRNWSLPEKLAQLPLARAQP